MPPSQSASFSTTGKSRWMKALPERWINSLSTLPKRRARKPYAKNHPVLVVRQQPRRGDELLCFDFQKFKDRERQSIRRSGAGSEGSRDGRDVRTRWTTISRTQRRSALYLHARHIDVRELRDAGRDRRLVGETFRGRREIAMRLAQGQIRFVMANRSLGPRRHAARQESSEIKKHHASDAANEQTRHRKIATGIRAGIREGLWNRTVSYPI